MEGNRDVTNTNTRQLQTDTQYSCQYENINSEKRR